MNGVGREWVGGVPVVCRWCRDEGDEGWGEGVEGPGGTS